MNHSPAASIVAALSCMMPLLAGCGGSANAARSLPDLSEVPAADCGISVARAYTLIPHRRTEMDLGVATMPRPEKAYLNLVFHVIDQAITLRVTAARDYASGKTEDAKTIRGLQREVEFLKKIDPPVQLKTYHEALIRAITDQTMFFEEWNEMGAKFRHAKPDSFSAHPKVQSASKGLRKAHELLLQAFPSEAQPTKDAFFDYHCALDFI